MPGLELFEEANRQLVICNACRYCEGFCPVFKAVEVRRNFSKGDVLYLSNLCHDCRACYYACMYIPPHEFAINIPKIMSEVRMESYRELSWPRSLAQSFKNSNITGFLACFAAVVVLIAAWMLIPSNQLFVQHLGPGAFYTIVPYTAMVVPAVALFFYGLMIWLQGSVRFWSGGDSPKTNPPLTTSSLFRALGDAFGLKYLGGGGPGCSYPEEQPSSARRIYHSLVFWGFLSAFVSTTLAFIYEDFFQMLPPYPLTSAPVIFGTVGGIGIVFGTAGLLWFKVKSDRAPAAARAYGMDYVFLVTLGLTALTGILTLAFRDTTILASMLILHLASIAALFITAPYGKFVHFVYRVLALVRYQIEQGTSHQTIGH